MDDRIEYKTPGGHAMMQLCLDAIVDGRTRYAWRCECGASGKYVDGSLENSWKNHIAEATPGRTGEILEKANG